MKVRKYSTLPSGNSLKIYFYFQVIALYLLIIIKVIAL